MKVLHLFSNYKWTGPAEPAVLVAKAVAGLGAEVEFACQPSPRGAPRDLFDNAVARGITPLLGFNLTKHHRIFGNVSVSAKLAKFIRERGFDVVHAHQLNDHLIGGSAARQAGAKIVRTIYDGEMPEKSWRYGKALRKFTDALISISPKVGDGICERFEFPREKLFRGETPIDCSRFAPGDAKPETRARLGIPDGAFVLGIVARIQRKRNWDLVLDVARHYKESGENVTVLVIGRGTNAEEVLLEPMRRDSLAGRIVAPGYQKGDDLVDAYRAMDALMFLVPGSDGSCRAVREAMACGVPPLVTNVGMLPEMVAHNVYGYVLPETAKAFIHAVDNLIADPEKRKRFSQKAAEHARENFDTGVVAKNVMEVYESILKS
ncbi:MAG: glycosyltransferase family 4 protein [Planctomycetes bacterium]|nr:glycosyltransferase family 4 protein [Planctomycetota bacterium]